jgi:hypothetical protein
MKSLSFGGKTYTPAQIEKILQDNLDLSEASDAAKRAWIESVVRADESEQKTAPTRSEIVAFVVSFFGKTSSALADFGISPRKARRALTTEEMATAIAKRDATRTARHTMGKRQKLDVVGRTLTLPTRLHRPHVTHAPSHHAGHALG